MASRPKHHSEGGTRDVARRVSATPFQLSARETLSREGGAKTMAGVEPVTEKRCTGCSEWLPLEGFPLNCRMHLGRSSRCRKCHRAATKDWRERNRERVNAERRAAYQRRAPASRARLRGVRPTVRGSAPCARLLPGVPADSRARAASRSAIGGSARSAPPPERRVRRPTDAWATRV
jgi:hypothetical protein